MKILDAIKARIAGAQHSASSALEKARTAAAASKSAADALGDLRAEIAKLESQIMNVERAALPREDVATRARQMIEERRAVVARQWQHFCYTDHGLGAMSNRHPEQSQIPREIDWFSALCVEDPRRAESLLVALYEHATADHAEAIGEPLAHRPALLSELRETLSLLESAEETLVDEMLADGLPVTHRQKTLERRQAQESRRAHQEAAAPARKSREVIIDEQHSTSVRSAYLSGGGRERSWL